MKKKLSYPFLFLCILITACYCNTCYAEDANLSRVVDNIMGPLSSFIAIFYKLCYIIGAMLIIGSFIQYRLYRKNPIQVRLSNVFFLLIIGIVVLCLPTLANFSSSSHTVHGSLQKQHQGSSMPKPATPITPKPITPAPVTPAPITPAPVTPAPVTPAPVTPAPVTPTPVTPTPVTPAPVIPAPVTSAPVTSAPVTPTPVAPAPVTPKPATFAPATRKPDARKSDTSSTVIQKPANQSPTIYPSDDDWYSAPGKHRFKWETTNANSN